MSDDKEKFSETDNPNDDSANPGAEVDDAAELEDDLQQLRKAYDELNDKYLRAVADFDNARKRLRSEQAQQLRFANEQMVLALLPVLDNLERALETSPGSDNALRSGVELTARMFAEVLARFGVTPIEAEGRPFDPLRHEAVGEIDTDELPEGTVVQQQLRGYMLHDRVVRPSRVMVARRKVKAEPVSVGGETEG